jgi:alpha-D-ribose 1-methylphosphonate 5-triphosphate synthase subunit PhnG
MGTLARAPRGEIEAQIEAFGALPPYQTIKGPETGTVMVEGRAGGTGRRFNAGEATVTRAVVRLDDGTMGFAYALGTDKRKAELSAVLDALLQNPALKPRLLSDVIAPLAALQDARRATASRKAAATKVDFFALVRGEG